MKHWKSCTCVYIYIYRLHSCSKSFYASNKSGPQSLPWTPRHSVATRPERMGCWKLHALMEDFWGSHGDMMGI